jgi:hypothetical protein
MTRSSLLSLLLAVGCSFDAGGIGHAAGLPTEAMDTGGTSSGSGGGTTIEATSIGSDAETSGMVTSASTTTTTGVDDTTGASSESGAPQSETSTGELDPCDGPPPFHVEIAASDAMLGGTMMLGMLGNGDQYVYSETANDGTATFSFATDCPGEYAIWGLVYDGDPIIVDVGGQAADRMQVNLGSESTDWRYGCASGVVSWNWTSVGTYDEICIPDPKTVYQLEAGDHSVVFVPTEGGTANESDPGEAAALQRIIITNDLDFSP